MTRLCGHLLSPVQDIFAIRDETVSEAGVPESGQSLTIWAGRALACARYTQDPNKERRRGLLDASGSAGVLSRGVGLRGFESHPPHQPGYPVSNCPGPGRPQLFCVSHDISLQSLRLRTQNWTSLDIFEPSTSGLSPI